MIRGGAATPRNKDFIITKTHQAFHGGTDCYAYDGMTSNGVKWG